LRLHRQGFRILNDINFVGGFRWGEINILAHRANILNADRAFSFFFRYILHIQEAFALNASAVFADAAGLLGGMSVGVGFMDIPPSAYIERTFRVLDGITFSLGILKCALFSILITLAGCYSGFQAAGDAQGVGRGATQAVVISIFLVIIADALMTLLYSFIGY
jgi:hypothetical protein